MAAYWRRILSNGKQVYIDIKSMLTVFKIIDLDCLSGHWKGVDVDVFFCKRAGLQHYNDVYKIWAHGL